MLSGRSSGILNAVKSIFRRFGRKLPSMPSSQEIDREYIEGETPEEIGEIGQMTSIPDKAQRHPLSHDKKKTA
jgi:hypothetical protein